MKRSQGMHFSSLFLLLIQFVSINVVGQNSLIRTLIDVPNNDGAPPSTLTPTEERRSSDARIPLEPKALHTRDPQKLSLIDRAYLDAFTILEHDNSCSRFFGGRNAINALTEMVLRLRPRYLERDVAIRMSGNTTLVQSHATGFSFRVFERAEINLAGSFFRSPSPSERHISISPLFPPNTRETRVLVLLHELGHMVKGGDDHWVLSDDGNDPGLSLENTQQVVTACHQQITSVSGLTAAEQLEMTNSLTQKMPTAP